MTTPTRTRIYTALVIAGIFLLGAVAGGALMHVISSRKMMQRMIGGPRVGAEISLASKIMGDRLDLDDAQRAQLGEILAKYQPKVFEVRRSVAPRIIEIRKQQQQEIRGILRPEQIAKFNEIVEQLEARQKEIMESTPTP